MANIKCAKCDTEKGFFDISFEGWYRCTNCGPICDECDAQSGLFGLGDKKCPKCGRKLEALTDK